ncbi:MAG TPA: peroxidase family protein, partial [Acetobacteraceae bacterium]|nr:peroxidase family protein [Acetobacteraceae bacterium]
MAKFDRVDLQFVLTQIKMAEANQPPVNALLSFGLRKVAGIDNSVVPGQGTYGASDQMFPRVTDPLFQNAEAVPPGFGPPGSTSYQQTSGSVFDSEPRTISNLIADQTAANPAAVAAQAKANSFLGIGYQNTTDPGPDGIYGTADDIPGGNPASPTSASSSGSTIPGLAQSLFINNVTPDNGLSAPFSSWFTFFGQFFDHGLDLVTKGGSGTVFIPLKQDDPLYDKGKDGIAGTADDGLGADGIARTADDRPNFMVLTRATILPGPDGKIGTADDIRSGMNTITPFVDQSQTYSSHPSHQVFLREYQIGADGKLHSTGKLLSHHQAGADGKLFTADDVVSGMATWADVKAQALKYFGIQLTDADVNSVPLLATDDYGNFLPGAHGLPQLVTSGGLVEGNLQNPVTTEHALSTGVAFINDMAHSASPVSDSGTALQADSDKPQTTISGTGADANATVTVMLGNAVLGTAVADGTGAWSLTLDGDYSKSAVTATQPGADGTPVSLALAVKYDAAVGGNPAPGTYDNELLDAHYIAGDGRVNENIGLTAVHEVFHAEHNLQITQIKALIQGELNKGDISFATDWVLPRVSLVDNADGTPHQITDAEWNGERLFQAAKFATETQYQHLVFEEFARKVDPSIHIFGNVNIHLDAAITAEFAHVVYRFGHSMLDENINVYQMGADGKPMLGADGKPIMTQMGLIEAFTNPLAFAKDPNATADIILGSVNQVGNEIDEFVTGSLRNNLLGLPLDLPALNIARGRDTGVAPLNLVRNQIFSQTQDAQLRPYTSWADFGTFLKHPESLVNFIAAYGTHSSVTSATTLEAKRAAAAALVAQGVETNPTFVPGSDADQFMHSTGAYANNPTDPRAVHDPANVVNGIVQPSKW